MTETMLNKEQEFLIRTVKYIVKNPDDVKVTRTADGMGILYTLKVHDDDVFRIIGKEGRIINSIRALVRTIGYSNKVRAHVKLDTNKK
jgi:uncharacterized protein